MTLVIVITLIVIGLIMTAVTVYAILSAQDGVEDESGFHPLENVDPRDLRSTTRNEPPPTPTITLIGPSHSIIFRASGTRIETGRC